MFDIFTSAHAEQRAVLYEGSEELSVKTAKLMLSRLNTTYYSDSEQERVTFVLTKLGYLKINRRNPKGSNDSLLDKANEIIREANARIYELKLQLKTAGSNDSLLEKANKTIREANSRINELKLQLRVAEQQIEVLNKANQSLKIQLLESSCTLSNKDILGYTFLPSSQELRKRYKSLASIHHPDKGGSKTMMQRINDSYERLKKEVI